MKATIIGATCAALLAIGLASGCSKSDPSAPAASDAVDSTKKAIGDAVTKDKAAEVKDVTRKTIEDVKQQVTDVAAAADAQVKNTVERARNLITEKKYSEALNLVKDKLSGLKLTAEQQKLVESLKEQIQKAISGQGATDATKTASDLLKPKN